MYTVGVRQHIMIAHSFVGDVFGPAQGLHGATFIVDVELRRPELNPDGIVVDIGRATEVLAAVLVHINYKNLDDMQDFRGVNTTSEFMARWIFDRMRDALRDGELGPGSEGVTRMKVTLGESHTAWAAFEGGV